MKKSSARDVETEDRMDAESEQNMQGSGNNTNG